MWKEEEQGTERINANRVGEAAATGAQVLAVGCPFCMIMLGDQVRQAGVALEVRDLAEVVADRLPPDS